jgi:hypothetical protein
VFGGFSAKSLEERILDAGAVAVITMDEQCRGGKAIPLKPAVDEALNLAQGHQVKNVFVIKRTGGACNMVAGRDVWYHEVCASQSEICEPEWVEAELTQQAPIAQAWVHGEALPGNLAVLVPRHAAISDAELGAAVEQVNAGLPDYARVGQWLRADQAFSPANGLATANGRLRRAALWAHYEGRFAAAPVTPLTCETS